VQFSQSEITEQGVPVENSYSNTGLKSPDFLVKYKIDREIADRRRKQGNRRHPKSSILPDLFNAFANRTVHFLELDRLRLTVRYRNPTSPPGSVFKSLHHFDKRRKITPHLFG
jgi:hypothetical protein